MKNSTKFVVQNTTKFVVKNSTAFLVKNPTNFEVSFTTNLLKIVFETFAHISFTYESVNKIKRTDFFFAGVKNGLQNFIRCVFVVCESALASQGFKICNLFE